jgi:ATP-dependent helicase/nuclease subunit A
MTKSVLKKDSDLKFPHFIVLKASAGSGKTYTLTERFVQFILSDSIPKNRLRNILAVTFSNNAAREMKERVLLWLKSVYFEDAEVLNELSDILSLDKGLLVKKAEEMIGEIFDSYPDFQVRTIDSFMAGVFKSSAIDFGYNPDFEILMKNDALMAYAFDLLLRDLKEGSPGSVMFETVITELNENRRKDSAFLWDPSSVLLEEIKKIYRKLASTGKRPKIQDFSGETAALKQEISEICEEIESLIEQSGLERSGKSTFSGILPLIRQRRFADLIGKGLKTPPVNRVKKADDISGPYYDRIVSRWLDLGEAISRYTAFYVRACMTPYLKIYTQFIGIVEAAKRRQGRIFIEDINRNLAEYLNSEIVPDVYFRMGETIFHFLIDEFQDTSPVQWRNLFPLIENSLSQTGSAFIVGDTKQAIYGFRDADYTIMKRFESQNPFPSADYRVEELEINYRSLQKILDFNNQVFKENLANSIVCKSAGERSGLTGYLQKVRDGRESAGYAEVTILEKNEEEPPEKEKIRKIVEELSGRGYGYRDIAILTQKNEDAVRITGWLNEAGVDFISYSSLDIRRRKITGEIVSLLNFLSSPTDDLSFATFILGDIFSGAAAGGSTGDIPEKFRNFIFAQTGNPPLYKAFQQEFGELWEMYFAGLFRASGYLPLYDLISEIFNVFRVFEIRKQEESTLVKILEVVKDFEGAGHNSLRAFLGFADGDAGEAEWNMSVPRDMNAVHVMTVHKAKGLGFPVVLMVLYEDRNKGFDYILEEDEECVCLLKITKDILNSCPDFEKLYNEEALKDRVNRLNSLYVGFTRPEEELYVIGVKGKTNGYPFDLLPDHDCQQPGRPERRRSAKTETCRTCSVRHSHIRTEYRTSPDEFININERKRGEFIHKLLFSLEYAGDGYEQELLGVFRRLKDESGFDKADEEILEPVMRMIANEELSGYFRRMPGREIRREQEFSDSEGRLFRMDRVVIDTDKVTVIDYKTGGETEPDERHLGQIRNYMRILKGVYSGRIIEGIIASVDRNKVWRLL